MKRIILASVVAIGLASSSLYAYGNKASCNMQNGACNMKKMQKMQGMKHGSHSMMKSAVRPFMQLLHQLNLKEEQYKQIRSIMHEPMPKQESAFAAFGKDSFDKNKFVNQMSQKRENMLKFKADKIEKVYNVLTDKQKTQLRVLMDLQEGKGK